MKKFLCYDTNDAASGKINVDNRGTLKPVDSELSDTSTNPVQNKAIKSALDALSEEIANIPSELNEVILPSSTSGSSKKFKITVDDSGAITATEV